MAKRIIDNDDESTAKSANQRALEEIESAEREEGQREAKTREPNGPITVEVPDEEEEEAVREAGQRNAENRRNRYREQKEGRERAERERDELAARIRELEARAHVPQQVAQQQPAQEQKNPDVEQELKVRDELRRLSEVFQNLTPEARANPEIRKDFQNRHAELVSFQQRLNARIATGASQPQDRQREVFEASLSAKYPDVDLSPGSNHRQYADASYNRLVATGAPHGWATVEKAVEETRRQFRLGKSPPPSAATKARFSGVSSGSSGAAAKSGPTKVELTKEDRIMARAAFPKLKPEQSYKEFAKLMTKAGAEG